MYSNEADRAKMHVQNKKYENFVFISRLKGKFATQKIKKRTQF